jgi:allantoate deiminase
MLRLFFALQPSAELGVSLLATASPLMTDLQTQRVPLGNLHSTLSFVGAVAPEKLDALCAAAEFISAVEAHAHSAAGLVTTVGQMQVKPGASNVIPGEVNLTLDVRHQTDSVRLGAVQYLQSTAEDLGRLRGIFVSWEVVQETASVPCQPELTALLALAAQSHQHEVLELPSGAGHDAAVLGKITPAVMLFVQCRDGLSHHPDESAKVEDIAVALDVMNDFLQLLAEKHA